MTFDGTDRKAIKRREKASRQREAQRHNYTRHIMADRFGREWMWALLERCHIFQTPFVSALPDQTAFNLGEQNFGLQLLADIMAAAPQDYHLMSSEAQTRNLADERRDSSQPDHAGQQPGIPGLDGDDLGPVAGADYDPFADRTEDDNDTVQ